MATAVPAIDRAVAVLSFLRKRPFEGFTLSDIARETGVHKATCAAILTTMANHGMVSKSEPRKYTLGPELVGLSQAYRERYPAYTIGRSEIWNLAERTGVSCSAAVVDGDEVVILDIVGDTQPAHLASRIGLRVPLVPPNGTIFKAWGTADELNPWLDAMIRDFGGDRGQHVSAISAIRARGFSLGSEHDLHVELDEALRRLASVAGDPAGIEVAMMLVDKIRNYQGFGSRPGADDEPVNYLGGPVFGRDMRVVMSVNLFGRPGQIRRADVSKLGNELLATTTKITDMIGGVRPPGYGA